MIILITKIRSDMFHAHNLDLDILCEASSREAALEKLRVSTEAYVDHGINKGWTEQIRHPAPAEYWRRAVECGLDTEVIK